MTGVLAAVSLLAVAGCGGSADAEEQPKASKSPSASPSTEPVATPLTQQQVEEALIEVADLPKGWKVDASGSEEDDESTEDEFDAGKADKPQCQPLLDGSMTGGSSEKPKALAAAYFTKSSDAGPYLMVTVEAYTEKQAKAFMKPSDVLTGCESFGAEQDGARVDFTTSELSVRQVGDETVGYRSTTQIGDEEFYLAMQSDTVAARVGGTLITVSQMSMSNADQNALDQALEKLVEKTRKVALKGAQGTGV
ncbi:hypothetical protein [Streptomyces sp. N35]|uniref:hypothetical protein n=1 Tax=Streptomyces sp. N35 TaxID=2795730 RepID=UPI0018F2C474|nr:hypothetical protein [Streptomyces sp. N35]